MKSEDYKKIKERCEIVFRGKHRIFDEDTIHDAILSIVTYYHHHEEKIQNFNAWLNGAVHHHYCNYIKSKSKFIFTDIDEMDIPIEEFDFDESFEERRKLVYDAIQNLDDDSKETLIKRFYEGCSYSDISSQKGKSEAAIRKEVSRSIKKLSSFLQKVVTSLILVLLYHWRS